MAETPPYRLYDAAPCNDHPPRLVINRRPSRRAPSLAPRRVFGVGVSPEFIAECHRITGEPLSKRLASSSRASILTLKPPAAESTELLATLITRTTAAALIAAFAAMAAFTLWQIRMDDRHTDEMTRAQEMSELYTEARNQVVSAEQSTTLWNVTRSPQHLARQKAAQEGFDAAMQAIGQSERQSDRDFAAWAEKYFAPISVAFSGLQADPPVPLEEILREYAVVYGKVYESVRAGERGSPPVLDHLVDPATVDSNPAALPNPVTIIMTYKAGEQKALAAQALQELRDAEQTVALLTPLLYGTGGVLVLVLVAAMFVFGRREARGRAEMEQLRRVATTDPLTGLGNRRGFEEATKRLRQVPEGAAVALVMMDLDEFKLVNDTFGHARGDSVLTAFAHILKEAAPAGTGRFRIGGDEFALLLHGTESDAAVKLAETIRRSAIDRLVHGVTVSAGVAVLGAADRDDSLLRQQADAALYEAKLKGRNLVIRYHDDGHSAPVFPAAKLQAVRRLLEEGRVNPVFQPIWDMNSRTLLGYEGLSRPHDDYGLSGPQQAFDIAEQFGRAADLDALCRHHILAAANHLPRQARVFVNLSPYSLTHQSFSPLTLLREVEAAGLERSRVVFEITERSHVPADAVADVVSQLRSHGLTVALDDVGSGNSGLEMLRKVPFEYVKIDRGVILAAFDGGTGRAALMAILAFAAEARAIVIAEGIEDSGTFGLVRDLARLSLKGDPGLIHGVQGYFFGRPLPATGEYLAAPRELAA